MARRPVIVYVAGMMPSPTVDPAVELDRLLRALDWALGVVVAAALIFAVLWIVW